MTLSIPLSPDMEAKLKERAATAGKDVVSFVRDAVEEKLAAPRSFAEILAPVHAAFRATGHTEEQMTHVFEELRDEIWRESERPNCGRS